MADRYTPSVWRPAFRREIIEVKNGQIQTLITPELIEKLKKFTFISKEAVDGALSGLHKSYHLGQSIEFSQHKEYSQGDDLKDLDWKAFAKSDRYFIKQYETETNARVFILLDASGSMNFGSGEITKFEYARRLAGAISFLFLNQYDETGLLISNGQGMSFVSPHRGLNFFKTIAGQLIAVAPYGDANLSEAIKFVAEKLWRGISIIISDLIVDEESIVKNIKYLKTKKNDVLVLHILDPVEMNLDIDQSGLFRGLERDGEVYTDPAIVRSRYREEVNRVIDYYKKNFLMNNIHYMLVDITTPVEKVISTMISLRSGK